MSSITPGFVTRSTAARLSAAVDQVGGLSQSGLTAGATRVGGVDAQFLNLADNPGEWWFAELTDGGINSPPVHSWQEVVERTAGGWVASERSGVSNAYRVARAGYTSAVAGAGDLVMIRASTRIDGLFEFFVVQAASGSGTGSGGSSPGPVIGHIDTDVQCIGGVLWVVKRPMYQAANGTVTFGPATFSHTAGCCDCGASSGSGGTSPPPPPPPPATPACADPPDTLAYMVSGGGCSLTGTLPGAMGTLVRTVGTDWHDPGGGPCSCDGPFVALQCVGGTTWTISFCSGACPSTPAVLTSWTASSLTFTSPTCNPFLTGPFTITIAW